MWYRHSTSALAITAAVLLLPASQALSASPTTVAANAPAQIKPIEGSKLRRLTLTQKAAQRLDIQTAQVGEDPSGRRTAPYASVFYDLAGDAWVYTNPEPLTYIRHSVVIETIKGKDAYLKEGPPAGTVVVTVGVSELYGAEKGVGH